VRDQEDIDVALRGCSRLPELIGLQAVGFGQKNHPSQLGKRRSRHECTARPITKTWRPQGWEELPISSLS